MGPLHARAGNEDLHIQELMAGANGDSRIQFIVIRQRKAGQNLWGPQATESHSRAMLVFFDALGRETGKFTFPSSPRTGGTMQTLIGTEAFGNLPGAPEPDIVIPPLIHALAGKVCFEDNPANPLATPKNECVSYGNFAGETGRNWSGIADAGVVAGPPAPPLPITATVSLRRDQNTGRNSDFEVRTAPSPTNISGETFTIPVAPARVQGESLFNLETFSGNGRTCASCHVAADSFTLSPSSVQSRFETLRSPTWSFDPLFIGESAPSAFDSGFDFNLNTLVLTGEVSTPSPCTGELRGVISTEDAGRAKVLARLDSTTYLVYGGMAPRLRGEVTDGSCSAVVRSIVSGDLAVPASSSIPGIEDPVRMRGTADPGFPEGRALILENVDGFSDPPVFRKSPHLLNLAHTAPYGLSGEFPDLEAFSRGAIVQHFSRTLAREAGGANPDFRLPTSEELAALEVFMLAEEFPRGPDPNKFDLARFATTELQRRGREEFFTFGCGTCHGGPTLSETTISIEDKPAGVNASFNTGTTDLGLGGSLPCAPDSDRVGTCRAREFSTPQLFNLPNLGPFFHDGSIQTLDAAVDFYLSAEFGNSPANLALIAQGVGVVPTDAITAFLRGLVMRPYSMGEGPLRFGARRPDSGPTVLRDLTVTNTGPSVLRFAVPACRLAGADPDAFRLRRCPLAVPIEAGESRKIEIEFAPISDGLKSAILEIHPLDAAASGVDLYGVGGSLGPPPDLSRVDPAFGSTGGGQVTLHGVNFADGAWVTIGGVTAGFVNVVSPRMIVARTPDHPPGSVDVVVVNPDGQTTVLENAFTYAPPPDG